MPTFIDTHAHLDDDRFAGDLEATLARAAAAGVERILCIGIDRGTSEAAVRLAEMYPHILRAVVGIQPNHVAEAAEGDFQVIEQLAERDCVVGIGESGLDRYWKKAPFDMQEDYYRRHFALARRKGIPIVIHCREADADNLRMLREQFDENGPVKGVMHSFAGDAATAAECVRLGLHISFSGMVTYKNAQNLRDAAKVVSLDRLLVETDSPYLAPVPHRGKRNEPAFVVHTAAVLAEAIQRPLEEVAEATTANAMALFGMMS
jgi:TatD DNase family protein